MFLLDAVSQSVSVEPRKFQLAKNELVFSYCLENKDKKNFTFFFWEFFHREAKRKSTAISLDLMRKSRSPAPGESSGIWFEGNVHCSLTGEFIIYTLYPTSFTFLFYFTLTVVSCVKTPDPSPPPPPLDITACFEMFFLAPNTISPASHVCFLRPFRHESLSSQTENIFTVSHRLLSAENSRAMRRYIYCVWCRCAILCRLLLMILNQNKTIVIASYSW